MITIARSANWCGAGIPAGPFPKMLSTEMKTLASKNWPNNRYHVLVILVRHVENIYELPDDIGGALMATTRKVALALKQAFRCTGISTRQHNEPDGNQDVWNLHIHVFPRYKDDHLNLTRGQDSDPEKRRVRAQLLRAASAETHT